MTEPLIRFHDVDFAYEGRPPVLRGCSFRLDPTDRLALVGPNGSGKTTLLHLIVGLLHPASGHVEAFGRECRREDDYHEVRRRAGLLFQDSDDQLFCPTVAEDVAFGPLNLGLSRDEVHRAVGETLAMLGLSRHADRVTHKLSGGEKRLVALATVLAMRPEVLMLDEPTAGLDAEATDRLVAILAELPQTMIIVSHDRSFLERTTSGTFRLSGFPREATG